MSDRYICTGSALFSPKPKATEGAVGPMITSHVLKASVKSCGDQAADLLRLEVIGVVVAVREHVGADQDAALHFGAEALRPALAVHVVQVAVFGGAMAVAHAVEARQVGTGLGRRDDVVGRHRQAGIGQADLDRGRAELAVFGQRGLDGGAHVGIHAVAEEFLGQADAQAGQRLVQVAGVVLGRALQRGRIARVEAGHGVQQQGAVLGRLGHRPALVEAGGEGDHAVARDHAIGRLEAGQAAQRRRLADRAAGIGAGRGRRQARRDRRRRAARGAAGHAGGIPGILHRAEKRGLVRRAHGELVHVELAQRHHAGRLELARPRGRRRARRSSPASSSRRWCASLRCRKYPCAPTGCRQSGAAVAAWPERSSAARAWPGSCRGRR